MSIMLAPDGGLSLYSTINGEAVETTVKWDANPHQGMIFMKVADPHKTMGVVGLLVNLFGGGLQVEFNQSLLGGSASCGQPQSEEAKALRQQLGELSSGILNIADKLGIGISADGGFSFAAVDHALTMIGEQVAGANAAELRSLDGGPKSPFAAAEAGEAPAPAIGGVAVGEAQPGDAAAAAKRKRRTKAEIEADNKREAAEREAAKAKPPATPSQPTKPDPVATAEFQKDMAGIAGEIDKLPTASTAQVKPPAADTSLHADSAHAEQRVEPVGDDLDQMVDLLAGIGKWKAGAMPVDLHPLDSKRSPQDRQYADTAQVRLYFGYPLVEEYQKDPGFVPASPPAPGVNLRSDEGVVAAIQWMAKIHERAGARGVEIPQLDLFFGLGTLEQVIGDGVAKVKARREAAAAAAAQGRR